MAPERYKCYGARTSSGSPRFARKIVTLVDQFEVKLTEVRRPAQFCTPTSKNFGSLDDPAAQLTCYDIRDASGQPRFERRDVLVDDQFGQLTLRLRRAVSLCVPAEKNGVVSPLNIDSYKCYDARVKRGTPRFQRVDVHLADQFEKKDTTVRSPRLFCNPVEKNGGAIGNTDSHLVCYRIKDVSGQPRFSRRDIQVEDQFGVLLLEVRRARSLCVPATKVLFP